MAKATVARDPRRFYVYVIFRPDGTPCYVGKGSASRWRMHDRWTCNPHLRSIFKNAGGDLPVVKIREGMTDAEALTTEIALIAAIGRKAHGGPLVNLTDGGDGASGVRRSAEFIALKREAAIKQHQQMSDSERAERAERISAATRQAMKDGGTAKAMKTRAERPLTAAQLDVLNRMAEGNRGEQERTPARLHSLAMMHAGNIGRHHSEVTKQKMSASHRSRLARELAARGSINERLPEQ